tara:strand:+ start:3131 stop:3415 length:285 start_codon:yes stop_codon:yes gene_type:complete
MGKKRSRLKIYKRLVEEHIIFQFTVMKEEVTDTARRKANIFAVQNTERIFQLQFTRKVDKAKIIELLGNGQNIHGICTLMKMEKEEVIALLKGK